MVTQNFNVWMQRSKRTYPRYICSITGAILIKVEKDFWVQYNYLRNRYMFVLCFYTMLTPRILLLKIPFWIKRPLEKSNRPEGEIQKQRPFWLANLFKVNLSYKFNIVINWVVCRLPVKTTPIENGHRPKRPTFGQNSPTIKKIVGLNGPDRKFNAVSVCRHWTTDKNQ